MKKIWMQLADIETQGLVRAMWPVRHCAPILREAGIELVCSNALEHLNYDVFVFHRKPQAFWLPLINDLKSLGKKFVWETDDDLKLIPKSSPAYSVYGSQEAQDTIDWLIDRADHIIVSTEVLKQSMPENKLTTVLPNLVDTKYWPELPEDPEPNKIRILWAGSPYHVNDLLQIKEPVERLDGDGNIQFLFWGDLPEGMGEYVRIRYTNLAVLTPHNKYQGRVGLVQPVPCEKYPASALVIRPHIGIAPLDDSRFSAAKSNLKWLDYTMMGACTLASNVPPYRCIRDGVDGKLVKDWYEDLKWLISNHSHRQEMIEQARQRVLANYTWQSKAKDVWLNWFRNI